VGLVDGESVGSAVAVGVGVGDGRVGRRLGIERALGRCEGEGDGTDADGLGGAADGVGLPDPLGEAAGCAGDAGEPYASRTPIPPATAKYTPTTAAASTRPRPPATAARRRRSSGS
jgi:hypothetical protein